MHGQKRRSEARKHLRDVGQSLAAVRKLLKEMPAQIPKGWTAEAFPVEQCLSIATSALAAADAMTDAKERGVFSTFVSLKIR